MSRFALFTALLLATAGSLTAEEETVEGSTLYRVITIRAAPGEFGAWLGQVEAIRAAYVARGDRPPFVLRHSQGDHWDLMFLEPWESFLAYLAPQRMAERQKTAEAMALLEHWLDDAPAFREDLFALGPPVEVLEPLFAQHDFYHVEMFHALPYKKQELLEQRRMENDYLARTGQPVNTIWNGLSGSDVDIFTIGFHQDHTAFAAGSAMTPERKDTAARAAGFESVDQIAPYLRSLISRHQDTLAVPVN